MKAAELPSIGVAFDENVHGLETWRALVIVRCQAARQQDETGAGSEHGHAVFDPCAQTLEHPELGKKLSLYR